MVPAVMWDLMTDAEYAAVALCAADVISSSKIKALRLSQSNTVEEFCESIRCFDGSSQLDYMINRQGYDWSLLKDQIIEMAIFIGMR